MARALRAGSLTKILDCICLGRQDVQLAASLAVAYEKQVYRTSTFQLLSQTSFSLRQSPIVSCACIITLQSAAQHDATLLRRSKGALAEAIPVRSLWPFPKDWRARPAVHLTAADAMWRYVRAMAAMYSVYIYTYPHTYVNV